MLCDRKQIKVERESEISLVAATLSVLHHGEEDGDDVGEDGGNSQKERDKGTVGFFACGIRIKMRIRFSGRWKAGGGGLS